MGRKETFSNGMRMLAAILLLLLGSLAGLAAANEEPVPWQAEQVAELHPYHHKEASGLAPSRRRDDLLWLINDSGSRPQLHAITTEGKSLGYVTLQGGWNVDWEDLASFELDGKPYLAIGDIGDNRARRRTSLIYVVEEPELKGKRFPRQTKVPVAWRLRFRYPPGPRDAEAMAVDAQEEAIYLISKFEMPKRLYRLPLRPSVTDQKRPQPVEAERLGSVTLPLPEKQRLTTWQQWQGAIRALLVTSMAFDSAGKQAVLLSYNRAFYYQREEGERWLTTLAREPKIIALEPRLQQYEGICFSADGRAIFVVCERKKPGAGFLVRIDLPKPVPKEMKNKKE